MAAITSIFGGTLVSTIFKVILAVLLGGGGWLLSYFIKKWKVDQANQATATDQANDQSKTVTTNTQVGTAADAASDKIDQDLNKLYP